MSPKVKKILNIVVDVIVAIILVFALILAISTITSKAKGYKNYNSIFGKAYLRVESPSMAKDLVTGEVKYDNFNEGSAIRIKLLDDQSARKLNVGDVITFKCDLDKDGILESLNTHRIIEIDGEPGSAFGYITKGDNIEEYDSHGNRQVERVSVPNIVGIFEAKSDFLGGIFVFMNSSAGFFVCLVLPTLLVVAYCAVNLILVIRKEKKVQAVQEAEDREKELEAEREKIRAQLMAEISGGSAPEAEAEGASEAPAETEVKEEAVAEVKAESEAEEGAAEAESDTSDDKE